MIRSALIAVTLAVASVTAPPAIAQSQNLDLTKPADVVTALQRAGYKAVVKAHDDGRQYIDSAANGNGFQVEFYDCDTPVTACKSVQFFAWWKKEPVFTPELVNEWNDKNRFLKVWIDKDGDLDEAVDISTIGALSYENFADSLDWFVSMDGSLAVFLKEKRGS